VYIYLPDDQEEDLRERDNYDRLLRLVWTRRPDISGGLTEELLRQSLNGRMLLDGYAVAYIRDEEPWGDLFYRFQKEAMDAGAGLWAEPGWIAHAALNELVQ
jgi:endonuclease YncB( thermonuclease family)